MKVIKREIKKEENKKKIIASLLDLLVDKPIHAITTDEICIASDVSKRTLYSYYTSKDEMMLEVVLYCFTMLNEYMDLPAFSENDTTWISYLGRKYLEFFVEKPLFGRIIIEFNEKDYVDHYESLVNRIRSEANKYELYRMFQANKMNEAIFTKGLAITLWSMVLGFSQLIAYKKAWLEAYYGLPIEWLIDEQLLILESLYKGRC